MVSKWKKTVLLLAAAMVFTGGCSGKSTEGTGAAETTAAAAAVPETTDAETAKAETAADKEDAAPAGTEHDREIKDGPGALRQYESEAKGPGAEAETGEESGDKDIEAFAELVQEAVADKNMEALADLAAFPLNLKTADGETFVFENREEFLKQNPDLIFGDDLMVAIAGIDTATLTLQENEVTMGEDNPHIRYEKMEDGSFCITDIQE